MLTFANAQRIVVSAAASVAVAMLFIAAAVPVTPIA
jgi:hypothetical protein